ncbi:MAG: type II secretion system protein [Patescibacteria group bacterium]
MKNQKNRSGFTLLEILLVVAAISILAGIVIIAINPSKQLGDTRNAQRRADVNTILNAVYQVALDNNGVLPSSILLGTCGASATSEICRTGAPSCTIPDVLVDLSSTTLNEKYIVAIPTDPSGASTNGAGYSIVKNTNSRITVCAPDAEQSATISITR